jgi:DNA repair photolyase
MSEKAVDPDETTALRWPLAGAERDGQIGLFGVEDALTTERGTGRMSDLEFLHVTAKTIINAVPGSSQMPFQWTINAYRGCSHACTYCLVGDTPILMADGRIAALQDLRPGDVVYGTQKRGAYRRYTPSKVLAHWQTVKRAYRVRLADGTELIGSGDHRFLTGRGWKHIADNPLGRTQRAHLTVNDALLGTGRLAVAPSHGEDYQRGYLTGMIRSDGHLCAYDYVRPRRGLSRVDRCRVALVDDEPLLRTSQYLQNVGIATPQFDFSAASPTRRALTAIRTSKRADFEQVSALLEWPDRPTMEWTLGFLAGIFDAEGGHNQGVLRISNSDPSILEWITRSLNLFGFPNLREPANSIGVSTIRITGGLRERLRFFVSVDPATTRKRTIDDVALKGDTDLRVCSIEDLAIDLPMYDITTETGDFIANGVVSHNCFARPTHDYLGLGIGEDFDRKIVVKINAVDKLRAELRSPRWGGGHIAMGTNTDPYQRAEGKYRLTRGIIEALGDAGNPFSILTKSALVVRDLDVLTRAAQHTDVHVSFSIPTLDERIWRASEPGTPNPRRRVDAIRKLVDAGIDVGVLVAPVLPGLSDTKAQLKEVIDAVVDAGAESVVAMPLHLRPGVREHYLSWLYEYDQSLHAKYLMSYSSGASIDQQYRQWLATVSHSLIDSAYRRQRARGVSAAAAAGTAGSDIAGSAGTAEAGTAEAGTGRARRGPRGIEPREGIAQLSQRGARNRIRLETPHAPADPDPLRLID